MKYNKIFFLLISTFLFKKICSHKCIHDKIKHRVKHKITNRSQLEKNPKIEGRRLASSWRQMDIEFDFSNIQNVEPQYRTFLQDTIFPDMKAYLKSLILIKDEKKNRVLTDNCNFQEATLDQKYSTQGTEADLVIVVGAEYQSADALAFASHCDVNKSSGRPILGVVVININALKLSKESVRFVFEDVFHEIVHVLAFNSTLFDLYSDQPAYKKEVMTLNGRSVERYKMVTPKVVELARKHFNCDSIDGVYLENQGGESSAGSHFETIHFGQEVMTPQRESFGLISKFTFAILEDSGWYKVDYNKADKFSFGKDAGCDFFKSTSCDQNVEELCSSEGQIKCSRDFTTKTYCEETSYSDGCVWSIPNYQHYCLNSLSFQQTSENEQNGINSRCFLTNSRGQDTAGCYQSKCSNGQLKITVNGSQYECNENGQKISISENLTITCPNINTFCSYLNDQCEDDCNANGFCSDSNSCNCLYFYKGDTCSQTRQCGTGADELSCEVVNYVDFSSLNLFFVKLLFLFVNVFQFFN